MLMEFLRVHGCDQIQGYSISPPLSAETITPRCERRLR